MSSQDYLEKTGRIIAEIREQEIGKIREAAALMAEAIASRHWVHIFDPTHALDYKL